MDLSPNFANLIGIPYSQMHCWDLVRAFYKQVYDVELKHYFTEMPETRNGKKDLIYTNKGDFAEVDTPKFGDIIVFSIMGIESHIGIYISKDLFLHSSRGVGSCMERIERWSNYIVGYYGHTPGLVTK